MPITITTNKSAIMQKVKAGSQLATIAVTEAIVEYGNIFVKEDQGQLKDSALIASKPQEGKAIWDTPYAKKQYYTGAPSKDKNAQASLMWAEKGVKTYKRELDLIAQKAFEKGGVSD